MRCDAASDQFASFQAQHWTVHLGHSAQSARTDDLVSCQEWSRSRVESGERS